MSLKFDINRIPKKSQRRWASYVPSNKISPFVTHLRLGDAKASFSYRQGSSNMNGAILELVDGIWYTLYEIDGANGVHELPWMKKFLVRDIYGKKYYRQITPDMESDERYSRLIVGVNEPNFKTWTEVRAVPMTKEEYADWRVAVDREARENA